MFIVLITLFFASTYLFAADGKAVQINYGVVQERGTVKKDAKHAGGAAAGGLAALAFAGPRHKAAKVAASAAAGAAI